MTLQKKKIKTLDPRFANAREDDKTNQTRSYLALGSNLNDPEKQIYTAIDAIKKIPHTKLIATSSLYRSPPMGPQDQPDVINGVVAIDTQLSATELLHHTQAIEQQQGRIRTRHWGERTIDIDILLYDNEIIHTATLTIPHPGLKLRNFVLYPLAEIAPDLIFPDGTTLQNCLVHIPIGQLVKL